MRVLFISTAHNSLSQRAFVELVERGHQVHVVIASSNEAMIAAVEQHRPELIIAPFLKSAIPSEIWEHHRCLIVHPGIRGDRGPSSIDWAITDGAASWGVTLLAAIAEMDAGDIWASHEFPLRERALPKSAMYRNEVTEAAVRGMLDAIEKAQVASFAPEPLDYAKPDVRGRLRPTMKQDHRRIDWQNDPSEAVARKIRAADSSPGVLDQVFGRDVFLYGAHEEDWLTGAPGEIVAKRHGAVCRATIDGAVWITHMKVRAPGGRALKLPSTEALGDEVRNVPMFGTSIHGGLVGRSFREIRYREVGEVGYLYFDFYNGAMSTDQCHRLREAYRYARTRPTRVIALMGGADLWSNGIHLNLIEAAPNPADESWRNINAIDDVVRDILLTDTHLVIAGVRGNAGAGGAMMALAADWVVARHSVVFNPHYRMMGLFGSEYWTYSLPRRVGAVRARELTEGCQPLGALAAKRLGFVDEVIEGDLGQFQRGIAALTSRLAEPGNFEERLLAKRARRVRDERDKPLEAYREEELSQMRLDFYGPGAPYHDLRKRFVFKVAPGKPIPDGVDKARSRGPAPVRQAQLE